MNRPRRHRDEPARRAGPPRPGEWLFTTREGAERDLVDEFRLLGERELPRVVAPALLAAKRAPRKDGRIDPAFGRHGFSIRELFNFGSVVEAAARIRDAVSPDVGAGPYVLSSWVPDSAAGNPLAHRAADVAEAVETE